MKRKTNTQLGRANKKTQRHFLNDENSSVVVVSQSNPKLSKYPKHDNPRKALQELNSNLSHLMTDSILLQDSKHCTKGIENEKDPEQILGLTCDIANVHVSVVDRERFYATQMFEIFGRWEQMYEVGCPLQRYNLKFNQYSRGYVVNWMIHSSSKLMMSKEALHLGVNVLDRYMVLGDAIVSSVDLLLTAAACIILGLKFEDNGGDEYDYTALRHEMKGSTITKTMIVQRESKILLAIQWNLISPTALTFLHRLLTESNEELNDKKRADKLRFLDSRVQMADLTSSETTDDEWTTARMICDRALIECSMSSVLPSKVASMAVQLARDHVGRTDWSSRLELISGYSAKDLSSCTTAFLQALLQEKQLRDEAGAAQTKVKDRIMLSQSSGHSLDSSGSDSDSSRERGVPAHTSADLGAATIGPLGASFVGIDSATPVVEAQCPLHHPLHRQSTIPGIPSHSSLPLSQSTSSSVSSALQSGQQEQSGLLGQSKLLPLPPTHAPLPSPTAVAAAAAVTAPVHKSIHSQRVYNALRDANPILYDKTILTIAASAKQVQDRCQDTVTGEWKGTPTQSTSESKFGNGKSMEGYDGVSVVSRPLEASARCNDSAGSSSQHCSRAAAELRRNVVSASASASASASVGTYKIVSIR